MADSKVPRVWKKARAGFVPAAGSVWIGKLSDFRSDSSKDTSAYDGVVGSYVLVITEMFETTFLFNSYVCDGETMKPLQSCKKGSLAVLGDLVANDMLAMVEGASYEHTD